ncbi:MAG: hypothetical protein ACXAD7_16530 [Candidatus Kariarchaeaceae archaeon]|jgi:hypothetical protein
MDRHTVGSWLKEKDVKLFMTQNQGKEIDKDDLEEFLSKKFPKWFGIID